jgi:hypothetical protein
MVILGRPAGSKLAEPSPFRDELVPVSAETKIE